MSPTEWLRARHPGLVVWLGTTTGAWWGMHAELPELVEAKTAIDLDLEVRRLLADVRATRRYRTPY